MEEEKKFAHARAMLHGKRVGAEIDNNSGSSTVKSDGAPGIMARCLGILLVVIVIGYFCSSSTGSGPRNCGCGQDPCVTYGKRTWLIFDVNETVLDLGPVERVVNEKLGDDRGFDYFFNKVLWGGGVKINLKTKSKN